MTSRSRVTKIPTLCCRYSCNGLSCLSGNAATAGEDGAVAVINVGSGDVARRYPKADSCSIADVSFVKHDELLTANVRGQLKLFDLRSPVSVID